MHNTLVGAGIRDKMKLGASGKMVTASAIATSLALGADWCNSARAFMFSVGCIQAQRCNTNKCPVGVTTQDPKLQRALDVPDKATRVHGFHRTPFTRWPSSWPPWASSIRASSRPHHVVRRISAMQVASLDELYSFLAPNELLEGGGPGSPAALLGRRLCRYVQVQPE